jgi:hypothetical protein
MKQVTATPMRGIFEARDAVLRVLETMIGMVGLLLFIVPRRGMGARDQ